jgi:peptide/nickel transport system ATP-binding protein
MTEPVLSIRDLSVVLSRDGRANRVLDGISFDAMPGEIIALVGESGSGKSTIGLALQGLLPRVLDWLARTGLPDPQRIADSFPHRLSGGQRQRVLIAMSMMASPKLLIADEPTTALDVTIQAQILDLLRDLAREQQTAILFVTHDLSVAASLADRVLVLYAGRVAEIGNVRDVIRKPAHPYSAGLLAARFDFSSDRLRPLPTLPAERSAPLKAADACSYAHRCPIAQGDCTTDRPLLRATANHAGSVACHHADETNEATGRTAVRELWPVQDIAKSGVALELYKVSKSFATGAKNFWGTRQARPILKSVDLSIKQGECVALVGESGSGKSTILRIAAGLLQPDGGDVSRVDKIAPQVVFQDAQAAIGEQIGERLRPLGIGADERRQKVGEALELVGLDPALMHALPSELSGGQCQRAVVARAVVVPPKLLLCDEPISAMDVSLAATTLNLLGDLRRRLGMAMLFVTHDLAAARIIADRIAVLQHGELVEDGDPDAVIGAPKAAYTRSLIAAMPNLHAELSR